MIKVESCHVNPKSLQFKYCDDVCMHSARLYNTCVEYINKTLKENDNWKVISRDGKSRFLFDVTHLHHHFKNHQYYASLFRVKNNKEQFMSTKILTQVFRSVSDVYRSYLAGIKSFKKDKSNFNRAPQLPKANKIRFKATMAKEAFSIKRKGFVRPTPTICDDYFNVERIQNKGVKLKQVVINPTTFGYVVNVIYDDGLKAPEVVPKDQISSICGVDLGLNNLASCGFNFSHNAFLIDGKVLKSINQRYNKRLTYYKSELPNDVKTSSKIKKLTQKRNNRVKDYMHKASKKIINFLVNNKIECLVVGSNKQWKKEINIGKRNNQNFVSIPYFIFKRMLKYKCEEKGIHYLEREESYTSKTSFLDMEDIQKQNSYKGKRIKRGLFRSGEGIEINADLNGALNIIRKEFGNDYFREDKLTQLFSNPKRIKVLSDD